MLTIHTSPKSERMGILVTLVAAALVAGATRSAAQGRPNQPEADVVDSGTLTLSRRQFPVGTERYSVTREGDALVLRSNITAQVRSAALDQTTELRMGQDYTPRRFSINGDVNAWA